MKITSSHIKACLFAAAIFFLSSCLTHGLEELPTFDEANISNINFDFRYKDPADKWIDGEPVVKVIALTILDRQIDDNAGTVSCRLKVPDTDNSFTDAIRAQVSLSNIVGKVNLSTAASISPIDNSPALGVPGDFSTPRKYRVTAANGSSKTWTITVTGLDM